MTESTCAACHKPTAEHDLEAARRCLQVRAAQEDNYCRLTGPKRPTTTAVATPLKKEKRT